MFRMVRMSTHTAIPEISSFITSEPAQRLTASLDRVFRRLPVQEPSGPDHGGEDEANFTLSWLALEQLQPDPERRAFLDACFRDLQRWVREECYKGYQPIQEAHHGTEPFLLFLPRYAQLPGAPREEIAELVCGAADYILGRVPGQPQWFDEQHQRFVSLDLGSKRAEPRDIWQIETADHLRFIHIALTAYEVRGDQAYADWACAYAEKRAQLINQWPSNEDLPWAWWHDGRGIFAAVGDGRSDNLLAPQHHLAGDRLAGIENLLASGVMEAFAKVYKINNSGEIAQAASRLAVTMAPHISDPYADPLAASLRMYRRAFAADKHYKNIDERLRREIACWPTTMAEQHLVLPAQAKRTDAGVGRRADMQRWYEMRADGLLQATSAVSTAARALAYEVIGEEQHVYLALEQAEKRIHVAVRGLRCGREHADMGSSIAACGAGHGRCWGTGNVTGIFDALAGG